MVDADGATDINDFEKVYEWVQKIDEKGLACTIGSRNQEEDKVKVTLSLNLLIDNIEKGNQKILKLGNEHPSQVCPWIYYQGYSMWF